MAITSEGENKLGSLVNQVKNMSLMLINAQLQRKCSTIENLLFSTGNLCKKRKEQVTIIGLMILTIQFVLSRGRDLVG